MNTVSTYPFRLWLSSLLVACCLSCSASVSAPDSMEIPLPLQPSAVLSPWMPDHITLFGEEVPLQMFDVRESLERELIVNSYLHSATLQNLKRATRFFPVIEPILKEKGLPDDFKYLCVIESNLTQAVSSAGAAGFWQIMKSTAVEYGLEVSTDVDERYHIEKATAAACRYLETSKEMFGSWTMAAAAYNMGKAGAQKQVARQRVTSYYDLHLNDETARYVYRIIALKLIMEQPGRYGFILQEGETYEPVPYETVNVSTRIASLTDFALEHGTSYKMLKLLNPWLRETYLEIKKGKPYEIRIPAKGYRPNVSGPAPAENSTVTP